MAFRTNFHGFPRGTLPAIAFAFVFLAVCNIMLFAEVFRLKLELYQVLQEQINFLDTLDKWYDKMDAERESQKSSSPAVRSKGRPGDTA